MTAVIKRITKQRVYTRRPQSIERDMPYLEVIHLNDGSYVRPFGAVGTCGFSPRAWQIALIEPWQTPVDAFLEVNPKWSLYEHEMLVR